MHRVLFVEIAKGLEFHSDPYWQNFDIVIHVIKLIDEADEPTRRTMVLQTPSPIPRLIDVVKQLEDKG